MIKELEDVLAAVSELPEKYQKRALDDLLKLIDEWEDRSSLPEMADEEYRELRRDRIAAVRSMLMDRIRRYAAGEEFD